MPNEQVASSESLNRQRIGLLAACGAAIGLGGFAIWFNRKRNLAKKQAPPPRAQLRLSPLEPSEPGASSTRNGASTSSSPQADSDAPLPPSCSPRNRNGGFNGESHGANGGPDGQGRPESSSCGAADSAGPSRAPAYGWLQTQAEAFLVTTCPLDVKSREVQCSIQSSSLQLSVRGEDIATGLLFAPVDASESIWELENLEGQKMLTVTLVKAATCSGQSAEWPTLLKDNPMPALNTIAV